LLGDLNAKVGKENIFKPTIGSGNLHEISKDNEVRVLNFSTYKNLRSKVQCSHFVTSINLLGHLLMERLTTVIHKLIKLYLDKEELPDKLKESIIVPVHNKGYKTDCSNYHGISLLSTSYKILSNILPSR
jgi:hypothetical protein